MKTRFAMMLLAVMMVAAAYAEQPPSSEKDSAKASKKAAAVKPPRNTKDATVKQTPFGPVKVDVEKSTAAPKQPSQAVHLMDILEKGDRVIFRKKTPFGVQTWSKKRSDLTEEERGWVEAIREDGQAQSSGAETPVPKTGVVTADAAPGAKE